MGARDSSPGTPGGARSQSGTIQTKKIFPEEQKKRVFSCEPTDPKSSQQRPTMCIHARTHVEVIGGGGAERRQLHEQEIGQG